MEQVLTRKLQEVNSLLNETKKWYYVLQNGSPDENKEQAKIKLSELNNKIKNENIQLWTFFTDGIENGKGIQYNGKIEYFDEEIIKDPTIKKFMHNYDLHKNLYEKFMQN